MRLSGLEIVFKAVKIRLRIGEELENILASYMNLTEADKEYIRAKLAE